MTDKPLHSRPVLSTNGPAESVMSLASTEQCLLNMTHITCPSDLNPLPPFKLHDRSIMFVEGDACFAVHGRLPVLVTGNPDIFQRD